jgi:hypothetical protein
MEQEPQPHHRTVADEATHWIALERDAAWTAKLAIVRLNDLDDLQHFGECRREHERHIEELAHCVSAVRVTLETAALEEPSFVTREPHIVGGIVDGEAVLEAMEAIETARIARYQQDCDPRLEPALDRLRAVLARHSADAHARLNWLRGRRAMSTRAH